MEAVWKKVDNMTHWYHGQIDPSLGSTPVVQQVFEVLKSLETLDVGVDVEYVKSSLTRALFVDTILVAAYVDVPPARRFHLRGDHPGRQRRRGTLLSNVLPRGTRFSRRHFSQ